MTAWTEGRIKGFIVGVLRAGARRWPAKFEVLNKAFSGKKLNEKSGRQAKHFNCNLCHNDVPASEIQVDHIEPVVDPKIGFVDWNTFIARLFCGEENLQAICKKCHNKKTKKERKISVHRTKNKKE